MKLSGNGDLCASAVGDTIGHFTMGCIVTTRVPILFLVVNLLLGPAIAAAQQVDVTYGPLPVFELHSGFWINLHHRLYEEARARRSSAPDNAEKPGKAGKPSLQVAPSAKIALSAAEQRAWDDAVSYY